jgi:hypothetical protein
MDPNTLRIVSSVARLGRPAIYTFLVDSSTEFTDFASALESFFSTSLSGCGLLTWSFLSSSYSGDFLSYAWSTSITSSSFDATLDGFSTCSFRVGA